MKVDGRPIGLGLLLGSALLFTPESDGVDHSQGVVEVRGEVARPGYWLVPRPIRLADALRAAGEPSLGMDHWIGDGMRLNVGPNGYTVAPSDMRLILGQRLSISHASADALQQLSGIGPSRAESIVAFRNQNGPFKSVGALREVRGIGPKTVDKVRPFLMP